jgi:hypothetical protein
MSAVDPQLSNDDDKNGVTESLPPSHITEDGRFVYLPAPNLAERSKFFERSIARHGLLQADMLGDAVEEESPKEKDDDKDADKDDDKDGGDDDKTAPKVHPLAVASARLQANGLAELNRAINLAQLVTTNEFFGLTNIVDPSLEGGEQKQQEGDRPADAIKSTYVLKRKRAQFVKATDVLQRHERRLRAAVQAQRVLDNRLFALRQHWRLVAPEHGTRARLHSTRPTEVVAIDVDVYDRDRVGGGNQALKHAVTNQKTNLAGRLASRVPRFATIELRDEYKVKENEDIGMGMDTTTEESTDPNDDSKASKWTRAEPFAIADPTRGRVMENFDPSRVPMLNLQLDIEKSSTGALQSACLEPMTTLSIEQKGASKTYAQDEELLITLQHSLFCASLFESIRAELDPPPEPVAQFSPARQQRNATTNAWLSCESEQNFLPPPSRVVGGGYGLASLSVVHCHEGEVKVQLDAEYMLCVKLVEANDGSSKEAGSAGTTSATHTAADSSSGSQSPEQLHALCRALLLHSQDVYHRHSLYLRERANKKHTKKDEGTAPRGLARIAKEDIPEKPRILQSCVGLGSKLLFEQRIRKALVRLAKWLRTASQEKMTVDWLDLSVFDLQSHFTLRFRQLVLDVHILRDSMTVARIIDDEGEQSAHRKVQFHSDAEFEVFLKMDLKRQLRR